MVCGARQGITVIEVVAACAVLALLAGMLLRWTTGVEVTRLAREATRTLQVHRAEALLGGVTTICVGAAEGAVVWPPRGLTFTPDGLPRTCDGGGVGNTTILLEHRGRRAAVIVSSLGRVRWELR